MSLPPSSVQQTLAQAVADLRAGRMAQAESGYRKVLATDPNNATALCHLGMIAAQSGNATAAISLIERSIKSDHKNAEAHNTLGAIHASAGRNAEAEACFRGAVAADPRFFDALRNLGTILIALDRAGEALPFFDRAIAIQPLPPPIAVNYAVALAAHDRLDEAERILRTTAAQVTNHPAPATNLAMVLQSQGKLDEALTWFDRAIAIAPQDGDAHYNRSFALLLAGRYAEGWAEHEWRRRKARNDIAGRTYPAPIWGGEVLNAPLFVYAEQGLGDTLQFARFLPLAAGRASKLIVEAPKRLHRLLKRMTGVQQIEFVEHAPATFAAHAGLMSLPFALKIGLDDLAASNAPYLAPESALIAKWRQRLGPERPFRIGIAWQGSKTYKNDRQRSIPLKHFAPLAAIPGVQLVSLQKGLGSDQIAGFGGSLLDLGPELDVSDGFVDTAALICSLDLVISSDTSAVHLAGALGRPVWTLVPFAPDWRWLRGRDDSPWYPTMRLVRQTRPGDWDDVFARVSAHLRAHMPPRQA